jgi:epoxyqueuosine reductase
VRLGARFPAPDPGVQPTSWLAVLPLLTGTDEEVLAAWGRWYLADRDPRWVRRNALIVLGNTADPTHPVYGERVRSVLADYLAHHDPVLRTHAEWAAQQLGLTDPRTMQP